MDDADQIHSGTTRRQVLKRSLPAIVGLSSLGGLHKAVAQLHTERAYAGVHQRDGRPVLFDHDGGLDDFISLLLLLSYEDIDLRGIAVTPADCLGEPAVSATRKFLDLAERSNVSVSLGEFSGKNPFPLTWRLRALQIDMMPFLNRTNSVRARRSARPAHEFLANKLYKSHSPITILATGPLTNLAHVIDSHPELETKIRELVWMGGALHVEGNVDQPGHDKTAEWNVYWDPAAARRVFESTIPITMFGLDATNSVPVTAELCYQLAKQDSYPFSLAAATILAMTFGNIEETGIAYCCWDSLATSYLAVPEIFSFEEIRCQIISDGPSQGRTMIAREGRPVKAAIAADADRFYQHCVAVLRR